MSTLSLVQTIAVWIAPVLLAITLHEAAHAWVANRCGDSTAKMLGRLSANPLRHVDPIGTILVPIAIGVLSHFHFVFGWAKPVPINWHQLRRPRRDMALVAVAGPLSNLIMALIWASCMKVGLMLNPSSSMIAEFMFLTGRAGIFINLILAFLNLIPVPPLDGSRIFGSILPPNLARYYLMIEPFGLFIILAMLFSGALRWLLGPPLSWSVGLIYSLFQIG